MKAAIINCFGGPEVIEFSERPTPEFSADEVLIRVASTAYNPADALIRSGALQQLLNLILPHTLGIDVAGIVEDV